MISMTSLTKELKILICGGGNGAHCFAGLASSRQNIEVSVLSLYEDEAERWTNTLKDYRLTVNISQKNGSVSELSSSPSLVTNDPKLALDGVHIIFIVVPAYAHENFLQTLLPYIKPNTLIVGMPGHAGFELQCKYILKEKAKICSIIGFESLPWACRILDYGKLVQLLAYKDVLRGSFLTGSECKLPFQALETVQYILGDKPKVTVADNIIAVTLMAGSMIHPPIMYGKWKDWDGKALKEKPLFYQGADEFQANVTSILSDELVSTAKKIGKLRKDLDMTDVIHIFDWYKTHYRNDISDFSSLQMALRTNKAYIGLVHPMKSTKDGFVPDFDYRYTTEDVPFGLVVMKGIAEMVGEITPTLDEIIKWTQSKLGKEYIVGSKLVGKDVKTVRAPQSFGLENLTQLLNFMKTDMIHNISLQENN